MSTSGSEYEHILVGLLVMQLGFILSAMPLLFVRKKARLLQRRDLTRWQKHIPSFIALMIASLIAAFGFSLAIFFLSLLNGSNFSKILSLALAVIWVFACFSISIHYSIITPAFRSKCEKGIISRIGGEEITEKLSKLTAE